MCHSAIVCADRRSGAALPLALFALVVIALLVSLILDGALQEFRSSSGDLASVRATASVERALALRLSLPADSATASMPPGGRWEGVTVRSGDTTTTVLQSLGGPLARLAVTSRSWHGGARADAGAVAFVRFEPDSAVTPAVYRVRPLPGWWWTPNP